MNNDELHELLKQRDELMLTKYLTKLTDYCRHLQKKYMEGAGTLSGIDMAHSFLQNGSIQRSTLIGIYDAIRNYNTPYELQHESNSI